MRSPRSPRSSTLRPLIVLGALLTSCNWVVTTTSSTNPADGQVADGEVHPEITEGENKIVALGNDLGTGMNQYTPERAEKAAALREAIDEQARRVQTLGDGTPTEYMEWGNGILAALDEIIAKEREEKKRQQEFFEQYGKPYQGPDTLKDRQVAGKIPYTDVHPSWFVFIARPVTHDIGIGRKKLRRPLEIGEPVILRNSGGTSIVTIDGIYTDIKSSDLSTKPLRQSSPHPAKPEWMVIEDDQGVVGGPRDYREDTTGFRLKKDDFLRLADPRSDAYVSYVDAREKVVACYEQKMKALDPDGRRWDWNQVTFGADGDVEKTERLSSVFDRKACKKCGCKKFNAKKRAFAESLLMPRQREAFETLAPTIEKLDAAFAP